MYGPKAAPLCSLALLALIGCQGPNGIVDDSDPNRSDGGNSTGGGAVSGLPCEVAALLGSRCATCHGSPLVGGAPMALLTYEDLLAPSAVDQRQSNAERSLARMTDSARPMPPGTMTTVPAADVAAFQAWLDAGAPRGSCSSGGGPGDPNDPLNAAPTCTSSRTWTQGNRETPLMNPGAACITCHSRDPEAPALLVGGTVYPSGHEPDLCIAAAAAGAVVEITDAQSRVTRLTANQNGNFVLEARRATVAFPVQARLLYQGKERVMATPAPHGDCNACHTQSGANGAPGRITLPF